MTTWLDDLVEQHKEFESPLSFWKWSGMAAISAVVKDQIWLPRYLYNLYPNIYVMLHAESGLKKGPPVAMAGKLVSQVNNTKIIQGRASIQAILKEMGTATSLPGGKISPANTAFICSSELAASIVNDPVATTILTDLYDRHYRYDDWASLLKMETFKLKDPTVTMLSATNDAMSASFFDKSAFQGGYFARTFIIYENKRNRSNSLMIPPDHIPDYNKAALYLKSLTTLRGPFIPLGAKQQNDIHSIPYTDRETKKVGYLNEVGLVYQEWYDDFVDTIDRQEVKDTTGTLNRFGDSVLKVAILLSLSKSASLEIDIGSMREAIELCEKLIGNVRRATMAKEGMSEARSIKSHIIYEFLNDPLHTIQRVTLMKRMWMHFSSAEEFDEIMNSFDQAGMITIENKGNIIYYVMPPNQVDELKNFLEGKNK